MFPTLRAHLLVERQRKFWIDKCREAKDMGETGGGRWYGWVGGCLMVRHDSEAVRGLINRWGWIDMWMSGWGGW